LYPFLPGAVITQGRISRFAQKWVGVHVVKNGVFAVLNPLVRFPALIACFPKQTEDAIGGTARIATTNAGLDFAHCDIFSP
jgi:hypothetical protein